MFKKVALVASSLLVSASAFAAPLLTTVDLGDAEADIGTAALAIVGLMIIVMGARIVIGFFRR